MENKKRPGTSMSNEKLVSDEISGIAFMLEKGMMTKEDAIAKLWTIANDLRNETK